MPYKDPQNLYFVWRDYGPIFELKRGWRTFGLPAGAHAENAMIATDRTLSADSGVPGRNVPSAM